MKKLLILATLLIASTAQAQYSKVSETVVAKQETREYDIANLKARIEERNRYIETLQAENAKDIELITEAAKVGVVEKAVEEEIVEGK